MCLCYFCVHVFTLHIPECALFTTCVSHFLAMRHLATDREGATVPLGLFRNYVVGISKSAVDQLNEVCTYQFLDTISFPLNQPQFISQRCLYFVHLTKRLMGCFVYSSSIILYLCVFVYVFLCLNI